MYAKFDSIDDDDGDDDTAKNVCAKKSCMAILIAGKIG